MGSAGIFVFRHGSRLLEDAVAALTARNVPRSKASGYVHLWVLRLSSLARQRIESQGLASGRERVFSLLEHTIPSIGSSSAQMSGIPHV
ncbi:hypothetical protein DMA10_21355 [Streptomyces sp. WAC 01420]|nr:hypothetical protein DLM49_25450 [Streptomyces sp. WAC 01438]RSM93543.1 hypothetical protein DMA10_21355 [Streptomyces sp. WAC 01420]